MAGLFDTTREQGFALAPDARAAHQRELGFFEQYLDPTQRAEQQQLLNILGTPRATLGDTPTGQTLLHTMDLPAAATERAAADSGIHPETLSAHIDTLRNSAPQLLDLLHLMAQHYAGQTPSLVDPRYATFFAPVRTDVTTPGIGNQIASGVGTAAEVAKFAAPLFRSNTTPTVTSDTATLGPGVSDASAAGLGGEGALFGN